MSSTGKASARRVRRNWLEATLRRNSNCQYLKALGSPLTEADYLRRTPIVGHNELDSYIAKLGFGECDVLFNGAPVAFERTGGSTGGSKLIPYSREGLLDFQRALAPWFFQVIEQHKISGSVYFSTSPAARASERFGGLSVGLPDGAYLGDEAGAWLMQRAAVPPRIANITEIHAWRQATLDHLRMARNLELISVWSPTFLLSLFDGITNTGNQWPHLKVISCWASGSAQRYLGEVARMFPHAIIEPKGLLATEGVVTVPDREGAPRLTRYGYYEFRQEGCCYDASELTEGNEYEVIVTTASGLYRYASGDRIRCERSCPDGDPIVEFIGRDSLSSDLVGEKLTDAFVGTCLNGATGFAMLVPRVDPAGYVLISDGNIPNEFAHALDERLCQNPQYYYARRMNQITPVSLLSCSRPLEIYESVMRHRGTRVGDIKPAALRGEGFWLQLFMERTH